MKRRLLMGTTVLFALIAGGNIFSVFSQCTGLACGGSYQLDQQVIASGGGKSTSSNYAVESTIAQTLAGSPTSSAVYDLRAGFWQAFLAPTAALVSVSGRVVTVEGRPIGNIRLTLGDGNGLLRTARSNQFGYFRFDDIEVGHTYIVNAVGKQYAFAGQVVTVNDEIADLVITALH